MAGGALFFEERFGSFVEFGCVVEDARIREDLQCRETGQISQRARRAVQTNAPNSINA